MNTASTFNTAKFAWSLILGICLAAPFLGKDFSKACSMLFLLLGFYTIASGKHNFKTYSKESKLFVITSGLVVLLSYINIISYLSDSHHNGKFELYAYYLVPFFILPFIAKYHIPFKAYRNAVIFSSLFTGLLAIIEQIQGANRIGFIINGQPIPYGDLSLLFGFLNFILLSSKNSKWLNTILLIACAMGIYASILSETRGAWIASPVVATILLFHFRYRIFTKRILIGATISILAVMAFAPHQLIYNKIESRMTIAINQATSNKPINENNTSVGTRFQLWYAALEGFKAAPIWGQGTQNYQEYKHKVIESGKISTHTGEFKHVHNEYLEILFGRGLIGISIFALLIAALLNIYLKAYRNKATQRTALNGIIIISAFLVFNLTESALSLHITLYTFILLNTILVALINQENNQLNSTPKQI